MGLVKIFDDVLFPEELWNSQNKNLFPDDLLRLLVYLHKKFNSKRLLLLEERKKRQQEYDHGMLPHFPDPQSEAVKGEWKISPIPTELTCRRVEITGPVNSAKMVINMLNRTDSGDRADMAMLDFEDSMKPSFKNVLSGFKNVIGAVKGDLKTSMGEKEYVLNNSDTAYVMVRVRGLHLYESNVKIAGEDVSAGLFDLVTCFFHTAGIYRSKNLTPKYYIPKCEHYLEARWWNELFTELELKLGFPVPTLRATFLIETLPATFQVEEILFEIRDHAVGLNVGRWDKIFSDIKVLRNHPDMIMADRSSITMERPWMENYAKRVIKICHDRGAFAMGGMAAFTPGKSKELRQSQVEKVLNDKRREAAWGHDGCWVSHPYFIRTAFKAMNFKNQLDRRIDFDKYSDIMPKGEGPHTIEGLRTNIRVGIAYMHGWHQDIGCVAFDNLMEDLATLEISRAQTWQWLHHNISLDEGVTVTRKFVFDLFDEELEKILSEQPQRKRSEWEDAKQDAYNIFTAEQLEDFLTLSSEPV